MDGRPSWQCQGRQYHGWFGDGTCGDGDDDAPADPAARRRTLAVLHGATGALPPALRPRWEGWLRRGGAARAAALLEQWSGVRLDRAAFRARFLPAETGDDAAASLHEAALTAALARDEAGEAAAATSLAAAVQAIGLDR